MSNEILDITAAQYHADPCERPSLSASIARTLVGQSPAHAKAAHPKLNPEWAPVFDDKFDMGTVIHGILLDGDTYATDKVDLCLFDNWMTKAAKEQKAAAYEAGKVPLLAKHFERAERIAAHVADQLEWLEVELPMLHDGKPEQTLVWDDHGVQCRARLDWLRDDHAAIDDLKTTGKSADPDAFIRGNLFKLGYDIQAAFYLRGLEAVTGAQAEFRFLIVETAAPYAVSVVALEPGAMAIANRKVDYALKTWATCLRENAWPAYPTRVCYAEMPAWEESRWLERELEGVAA